MGDSLAFLDDLSLPRVRRLIRILKPELERRQAKTAHSQRGGLIQFVRYFWSVLEPETTLVDGWPLEAICEHLEAVTAGEITRLLMTVPPGFMKSLLTDVFWPAWEWGPKGLSHHRYVAFSYSAGLTERDNDKFRTLVASPQYQALYGPLKTKQSVELRNKTITKVMNTHTGWKLASSVGGVGTGERGDRIIVDDPHNVIEAESEIVRNETARWFRESISSRFNDMDRGALIVIMQRVHEDDIAGVILSLGLDYTHLMIPWEYDSSRQVNELGEPVATSIGWIDPRYDPDDPHGHDGEPAWPERFSEYAIDQLRTALGPYAWCTPRESPVLMGDLSLKPIGTIKVGDEVVGFEIGDNARRAHLKPAKVTAISKSVQPVVRMVLDSGKVVRCTANHKWFTGRNDASHPPYKAASVGSCLKRVCPPTLPVLDTDEDLRMAGWVAGFFDGEGSASLLHRRAGEGSVLLTFHQSAERNLPLCEKLESSLNRLGFNWTCKERQPTTLSAAGVPWQKRRQYHLNSDAGAGVTKAGPAKRASRLTLNQRFLHVVQPTKWRDRIIHTTTHGRMYTTTERVVSIEPDGIETVYGLTTETGNYVVWGLASSNSGQYQQSPQPRGGGIFQRSWWQPWQPADGKFPLCDYVIASLDSAFTEKEENDPSALTVFGVFTHPETKQRGVIMIDAWRKWLKMHGVPTPRNERETVNIGDTPQTVRMKNIAWKNRVGEEWGLVEWAAYTCKLWKVDKLLIEGKTSGITAADEIVRLHALEDWSVQLVPVKGDKVARALREQPIFSQGMVWAPLRDWAEMVIDEMATFPKSKHDDLTDSVTQAIKYVRDNGLLQTAKEVQEAEFARVRHKSRMKPLYAI